jgi:hypothetical protein
LEVVRKDSVRSVKDNINQAEKEDTHIHQLAVNLEVDHIHHNSWAVHLTHQVDIPLAVNLALEVDRIHHNLPLVVIHILPLVVIHIPPLVVIHILEEGFPYLEVELVVAFKIVEELKHLGFTLQTLSMQ